MCLLANENKPFLIYCRSIKPPCYIPHSHENMPAKHGCKPIPSGTHTGHTSVEGRLEFFGNSEKMTPLRVFEQFRADMYRMKTDLTSDCNDAELVGHRAMEKSRANEAKYKEMAKNMDELKDRLDKLSVQLDTMIHQLTPPVPYEVEPDRYEEQARETRPRYDQYEEPEQDGYDARYDENRPRNRRYPDDVYDNYQDVYDNYQENY